MNKKKVLLLIICFLLVTFLAILIKKTNIENFTVKITNSFTSSAETVIGTWKMSASGAGNVNARLYEDGRLVISGTGTMKSFANAIEKEGTWHGLTDVSNIKSIEIGDGVWNIGPHAFEGCSYVTSVKMSNNITEIGYFAFSGCSSLTDINMSNRLEKIGSAAFQECSSLTNMEIPENVTSINNLAFSGCSSLASVNIPSTTTNIDTLAFSGCNSLKAINVDSRNIIFSSEDGILFSKDKSTLILYPLGKEDITNYIIPNTVTNIEGFAFDECNKLSQVEIPSTVTSIGDYAFYRFTGLQKIEIPNTVINIGDYAFFKCANLEDIIILNGVESIGMNAFMECTNLKVIEISDSVKNIKSSSFHNAQLTLEVNSLEVMPELLKKTQNENSILYTKEELELTNCKWNDNKDALIINGTKASIKVKEGALSGLTIILNVTKDEQLTLEITSDKYNLQETYIAKIEAETTQEILKQNIETNAEDITILNQDNEPLTDEIIGTGMTAIFKLGEETQSFKLVVAGDTTGDGKADFKDIVAINKHRLNKKILEGEYLIAGEVTGDDVVDFKDIVKINKFRLNKISQLF